MDKNIGKNGGGKRKNTLTAREFSSRDKTASKESGRCLSERDWVSLYFWTSIRCGGFGK